MVTSRTKTARVLAALLWASSLAPAGAVPPGFNIQGRLTDANAVNREGNYSIKFTLFDAPTGGTSLWTRTYPALTVRNGNFQTVIGDVSGQPMLSDVFAGETRHLEIQVLSGPGVSSPEQPLAPRQQLVSVPYAMRAASVEKADVISSTAAIVFQTAGVERGRITPTGQFGVGTSTPAHRLDVSGDINFTGSLLKNGAPLSGASFGGMYVTVNSPTGSCAWPNPAAGGCSCPAGYNDSYFQFYQPQCVNCGWAEGFTVLVAGYVTWNFLHQCWR